MKELIVATGQGVTYSGVLEPLNNYVTDPSAWVEDSQRGWYNDTKYNYVTGNRVLPNAGFKSFILPEGITLNDVIGLTGQFTSIYNAPSGGMGYSLFRFTLSDSSYRYIGTLDEKTDDTQGQRYLEGATDLFSPLVYENVNYVDKVLTYSIDPSLTVTALDICSAIYTQYPANNRGLKNITLILRS